MRKILFIFLILCLLSFPVEAGTPYTSKPPLGSQIDWGHPLSKGLVGCWLFNEGGGAIVNKLCNNYPSNLTSYSWKRKIVKSNGDAFRMGFQNLPVFYNIGNYTIILKMKEDEDIWDAGQSRPLAYFQSGNPLVYISFGKQKTIWAERADDGNGYSETTGNTAMSKTTLNVFGIVKNIGNGTLNFYFDGNPDGSYSGKITSIIHTGSCPITIFGNAGWATLRGEIEYLYIFNQALSTSQIRQLYIEPYCFIKSSPITNWVPSVPPTGFGQVI